MNSTTALQQLQIGYQRYKAALQKGVITAPLSLSKADEHRPIAAVISCSDARVVPEYLFGQSPGQLFGVRMAGNIVDTYGLASLEFAITALNVPLIVVLGHRGCGAIQAAVEASLSNQSASSHYLTRLIDVLKPIINTANLECTHEPAMNERAVLRNVQHQMRLIQRAQPVIAPRVVNETVHVVGAVYCHQKGDLQFIVST